VFAVAMVVAGLLAGPASAYWGSGHRSPLRPFGAESIWRDQVEVETRLSALSAAYVQRLEATIDEYGAYINTTQWSAPVYTVPANQPRIAVRMPVTAPPEIQLAFTSVPLPPEARPSPDNDAELVVWQPATDTMWEMFEAEHGALGWSATYGGRMTALSKQPGFFSVGGATASGLPLLGGLIRISELEAGSIPHALSLSIPEPRAYRYAWPAQRTDGTSPDPLAIPEGTRFRLDPSLDLSTLEMSPVVRTIARAAQRYGIYVTDRSGSVAFEAEDPSPRGSNPYPKLFGGQSPAALLAQFPWGELEAIDARLSCC
jgi:hypothetical protein